MKRIMILAALVAATVTGANARATFEQVLETVVKGNPDVAATVASGKAEIEEMKAENMLEGPEIEGHHAWGNFGDRKYGIGISQGFDWPGLYSARRGLIKATSEAKTYLTRSTVLDKAIEAKLLLIELVQCRRTLDLMNEMRESMTDMQHTIDKGFKNGEVSVLDKNKLDIEVLRLTSKADAEQVRYATLLTAVQNLAGATPVKEMAGSLTDYPADPVLTEEEYEKIISENDPMVNYYRAMGRAASRQQAVARMKGAPGFSIGYEREREEGQDFNVLNLGIKFSAWSTRHSRAAARLSKMENEVQLNATHLNRLSDMRNELATVKEYSKQVEAYSSILDNGNQVKLLRRAFDGGEIGMLSYLQEVNFFIEARIDYEEARYQLSLAKARLNKISQAEVISLSE